MAQDALKTMQVWQSHSQWNFQHRSTFLQAEIASFDDNYQEASSRYDEAVAQASKHGFVHEKVRLHFYMIFGEARRFVVG